jgi:transcriptional regulator with XRE-family HTH domain
MPSTQRDVDEGPDPIDAAVGARIRLQRQSLRMSQQQLGHRLGVTFQQIQKYERAANRISASMLVKASQALGCSPLLLLCGTDDQAGAEDAAWLQLLTQPGARQLLAAYAQIRDPGTRTAILAIAKGLAAGAMAEASKA